MKTLLIFLSFVLIVSCTTKTDEIKMQIIPVAEGLDQSVTIPIEEFGKSVKYIQLETSDSVLISYVRKIILAENKLVILHQGCSVFDLDGNYICEIGRRGQGPQEYNGISSVFVKNSMVWIYDYDKERVQRFSLMGDFVDEIKTTTKYTALFPLVDGNMLGFMDQRFGQEKTMGYIWNGSSTLDSIPYAQQYTPGEVTVVLYDEANIYNQSQNVFYKNIMNDTLYLITKNYELEPRYVFDQGKSRMIPEKRYQLIDPRGNVFSGMGILKIVADSKDYLFFTSNENEKNKVFCWNKKDEVLQNIFFTYPSNIPEDYFFIPSAISADEKYLISSLSLETSEENPVIVLLEL